ncbi:MAG: hypothetical protein J0H71_05460 [Rhizobiales bacterium]|nr:hypothetical protein [Hyphomicrobiales bacterium]
MKKMNRRTLKKHCRRAMAILIDQYGYNEKDFQPSNGEETIDAPLRMERRFVRDGWLEPGLLKGTPLHWPIYDHPYDDGGPKLPSDILAELRMWENTSDDEIREMLA